MINKKGIYLIISCLIYACVFSLYFYRIIALASDLDEKVIDIVEDYENGYIQLEQEIEQDSHTVLSDSYKTIAEYQEDSFDDQNGNDVPEDSQENGEVVEDSMNDTQIINTMIIFSLGLIAGIIAGHFLTGFLK